MKVLTEAESLVYIASRVSMAAGCCHFVVIGWLIDWGKNVWIRHGISNKHAVSKASVSTSSTLSSNCCECCRYEWYYNGLRLDTWNRTTWKHYNTHNSSVDGALYLKTRSKSTQGYYQCYAVNVAGVAMSNVSFVQEAGIRLFIIYTQMAYAIQLS